MSRSKANLSLFFTFFPSFASFHFFHFFSFFSIFSLRSISARTGAAASFGRFGISTKVLAQRYSGTRDGLHLFCAATTRLPARPKNKKQDCEFYLKASLKTKEA
ncbi:hypothetical protein CHX27_14385 [Flavobacterium aurantiibacter]|uniref:Uncharacterized protein n=1 Tax=Flavobacterium aurantiibacter TaxID=2023067 RepID=A0A255ZCE8_9FLAO|nr:hypothetical protein CHX27_14385 [Flavobacterium aurantiibacter]